MFLLLAFLQLQQAAPDPRAVLASAGLTTDELRKVDRGDPVVRLVPTAITRDVSVIGVVVVNVPRAALVDRVTAPEALQIPGRTALGIVGSPAVPADFNGITLSQGEVDDVRSCRQGSCLFKLPLGDMAAFKAIATSTNARERALAYEQSRMAAIVNAYRARGNDAMPDYSDFGPTPISGKQAFASIADVPALFQLAPDLRGCLFDFSCTTLGRSTQTLYWARDEVAGVRATTTIAHRLVFTPADRPLSIVATKMIAANHYFEAGLDVMVLADVPGAGGSRVYLMIFRRYRFDQMPGGILRLLRGRVTSKLRDRVSADLTRIRKENVVRP